MSDRVTVSEPGVYAMEAEAYHADPCDPASLSSSGARKLLAECPARYWYDRQNPPEPSEAFTVGSAAHEWLLEGETWPKRHLVLPDDHNGSTKEGKARVAEAKTAGLRPVKADEFATIRAMRDALAAHEFAGAAFQGGRAETALVWRDEWFGIWCRARLDFLPTTGRIFPDYKTTVSAHPDAIRKALANYGYHQQAAWYCDGIKALGLCAEPIFMLVFQEKTPPHLVTCVALDDDALGWGRQLNDKAKGVFRRCLRDGRWPGYAGDVVTLGLPTWETARLQRLSEAGALDAAIEMHRPIDLTMPEAA